MTLGMVPEKSHGQRSNMFGIVRRLASAGPDRPVLLSFGRGRVLSRYTTVIMGFTRKYRSTAQWFCDERTLGLELALTDRNVPSNGYSLPLSMSLN